MRPEPRRFAGVDVGADKGFDAAVIDARRVVAGPERLRSVADVVAQLREWRPTVVAVDSPCEAAPPGERSRRCERELVAAGVCGIRYTPDERALDRNPTYYAWIANGLRLYQALHAEADWTVIECFPTATWTRLGGPRGTLPRSRWSSAVLRRLGLGGVPSRLNQDARDAIGAALTAKLYDERATESFGGAIVVPLSGGSAGQ